MFNFTQITTSQHAVAQQLDTSNPHTIKKQIKGDLHIYLQVTNSMMLFKMDAFQYGINPNDQVIYQDKNPEFKLVLCLSANQKNCWVLKINDNAQLIASLLSERCKFIHKNASKIIVQQVERQQGKPVSVAPEKMVQSSKNTNTNPTTEDTTTAALVEASKTISNGFVYAGQIISQGLSYLSQYLSKNVEPSQPPQPTTLSTQNKTLIQTSIDSSKKVLQLTVDTFTQLFRVTKSQGTKILNQYEQSNNNGQNQNYKYYKDKLNTGMTLIGNLVDGLVQGATHVGNGIVQGTNQVVHAKYGKDIKTLVNQATQPHGTQPPYPTTISPLQQDKDDPNFKPTRAVIKKL